MKYIKKLSILDENSSEDQITGSMHKAIARQNHAAQEHEKTFYPKANQWRRSSSKDNIVIISAMLAVTAPCAVRTKDFILSTQDKIKTALFDDLLLVKELTHHADGRLIRHDGRIAIAEVLTLFLFRTDIETLKVGTPGIDGRWFGLDYATIAKETKLTISCVKRAVKKIVNSGIVQCHQQVMCFKDQHDETKKEYRQSANIYMIAEDFLKKLGMHKYWIAEANIRKQRNAQKRQDAQERAGDKAALQRLGLATDDQDSKDEITLKKVKTTTYHDVDTGKSHTTMNTSTTDQYGNTTTSARATFLKFKKQFLRS